MQSDYLSITWGKEWVTASTRTSILTKHSLEILLRRSWIIFRFNCMDASVDSTSKLQLPAQQEIQEDPFFFFPQLSDCFWTPQTVSLWSWAHFWVVITTRYEIAVVDERNGGLIIHEHTQQETKADENNIITESGGWLSCKSEHVKPFLCGRMCTREWEASLPFMRKSYSRKLHRFMCELPIPRLVFATDLDPGSPSGGRKMSSPETPIPAGNQWQGGWSASFCSFIFSSDLRWNGEPVFVLTGCQFKEAHPHRACT